MKPLTAAQLRAEAARVRAEALALNAYADELDAAAAKAPLTMLAKRSMVGSNVEANLAGKPENVRTSANRSRRESLARERAHRTL